MKRSNLVFVIVVMLLAVAILLSTCEKKSDKSKASAVTATAVETVAKAETSSSVKTEEPAPQVKVEESAAEVKAEEPVESKTQESAVEEKAPVIEEVREETPVIETAAVEEPVMEEVPVEAVKVELPEHVGESLYSMSFAFRGRKAEITAYSDYTEVRLISGTEEDILALASLIAVDAEDFLIQDGTVYVVTPQIMSASAEESAVEIPAVESAELVEEVEIPAVETAAVVEEEAASPEEEAVLFSGHFSYKGYSADIEAYSDHALITVPSGTTDEDVNSCAVLLAEAYPEAVYVQFRLQDDVVTLWYPEQNAELIAGVCVQLEKDAEYIIDRIPQEVEIEEAVEVGCVVEVEKAEAPSSAFEEETVVTMKKAEEPLFSTVFSYKGIEGAIAAYTDHAVVTLPAGTTEDDVVWCASLLVEAYPEASAVTYSLHDDILMLYYPQQSEAFIKAACSRLLSDAEYLIDSITDSVGEEKIEESISEAAVPEKTESAEEKAISDAVDICLYEAVFSYKGITSEILVYSDHAVLTLPEGTTGEDILYCAALLNAAYPEAEAVTYIVGDGIITLNYPAQNPEFILTALYRLADDAMYVIDSFADTAAAETYEEESSDVYTVEESEIEVEDNPVLFNKIFSYEGVRSYIAVWADHAVLTVPEGTTDDDITYCASLLVAAYPEAKAVTYSIKDDVMTLSYPEQDEAFLRGAYSLLERDAEMFLDSIMVEETVKAEEEERGKTETETAISSVVEEKTEPRKEDLTADIPAAVEKKKSIIRSWSASGTFNAAYNVAGFGIKAKGINLGVGARAEMEILDRFWVGAKFAFNFRFGYIQADFFSRYEFAEYRHSDFYGFLALGGDYTIEAKKFSFVAEIGAGYEYNFTPNISAFVEISTQYSWIRRFDINGNVGVRYTF